MPNRTYLDLSKELDLQSGLYSSFTRRYESIKDSLTSADINPQLKEAIYAGIWNAKSWYAVNGHLFNTSVTGYSPISRDSVQIVSSVTSQLNTILEQTNSINNIIAGATSEPTTFWGYESGVDDWNDELYEQLRLIDSIYGDSVVDSRSTQLALEQLYKINAKMDQLLNEYEGLNLPTNLTFTNSTENIDYNKVSVTLTKILYDTGIGLSEQKISISRPNSFNNLTQIEIPELDIGQYLLNIKNSNFTEILSSKKIENRSGWWLFKIKNDQDFIGWYIDSIYPIVEYKKLENGLYEIRTGNIENKDYAGSIIEEKYIEPISIVISVQENKVDNIYDFYYGSHIDEYIETRDDGSKVYYRHIKDTNGNDIALYETVIDFNTILENGTPLIKYNRLDT